LKKKKEPGKMNQNEIFLNAYHRLNEEQKKAVDAIEGPVLVIAGPGTGKTQILSARIGKILLDTDTRPENILCLTYTDAGVVAMRKRLLSFIGPDAYKVNISTFHAFCNEVIQENLSLFEKPSLDPISDLERIEYLRALIDGLPKNHLLKRYRGDAYFEVKNLQTLFSDMKREGFTAAQILQAVDQYIASLPLRDKYIAKRATGEFKKGDLRTDWIQEESSKKLKLRAAAAEFDHFQELMNQHKRYDFDDMINWVIDAFDRNESLLRRYQEQYLYILVDEYQDTSGTQNRILDQLVSYWDNPNLFVVGDDDQSIYRFQGASLENLKKFSGTYGDRLLKIVLTKNYRSTQPILDLSRKLIEHNNERLTNHLNELNKILVASREKLPAAPVSPRFHEYETPADEMMGICLQVEKLIGDGVQPGRIAVIYKENIYGEYLAKYFKVKDIPVFSKRNLNMLEIPLAKKVIQVLKYLATELDIPFSGDEQLFEILHFDWFGIPAIEVAKLAAEAANRRFSGNAIPLRSLLMEKAHQPARDLFSPGPPEGFRKASQALEDLISDVPNHTLQALVEKIFRKASVLDFVMKNPEKIWLLQVLTQLFDFVRDETRRDPSLTLAKLVSTIETMEKEGIILPMVRVSGSDKAVNLLTAHGSKGLEFEHVFIAACSAAQWENKRAPINGYGYPDTLFTTKTNVSDEEELRRLFYVAMTRAEKELTLSYSRFKSDNKASEPTRFIAEIRVDSEPVIITQDKQADFQALLLGDGLAPEIEKPEQEFITRILDQFVMNVTALNNYLRCPLEFYFRNLVRIPSPKNEATEFGSAVHYALEQLFLKMQTGGTGFPSKEIFTADFDWYMHRHRESFTPEQFKRRFEYGHSILPAYYERNSGAWNRIVAIERNIRTVILNGVPLKGKLDKLEFDGNFVNVVDYKTGDPEKAEEKLKGPNEKQPLGGDYWRQAVFYKILIDEYEKKHWQAVSTEFDFIEPDKKKNYRKIKRIIGPEDVAAVTRQISDTWQKIQQRDFYTGCGKKDCHWCKFVKTHELAIALHQVSDEEPAD
jgi:DNA helicase-2/ATP-dependent DNA helicase PcrA